MPYHLKSQDNNFIQWYDKESKTAGFGINAQYSTEELDNPPDDITRLAIENWLNENCIGKFIILSSGYSLYPKIIINFELEDDCIKFATLSIWKTFQRIHE